MLTATEWVECRCTTAAASRRCPYMPKCRNASLVAGSPPTSRPPASNFDSRAGSSAPSEALVGVINQPPSGSRTLMLPVDPKVSPRWKIESPTAQISSRALDSSVMVPRLAPLTQLPPRLQKEIGRAEIARLQRQRDVGHSEA